MTRSLAALAGITCSIGDGKVYLFLWKVRQMARRSLLAIPAQLAVPALLAVPAILLLLAATARLRAAEAPGAPAGGVAASGAAASGGADNGAAIGEPAAADLLPASIVLYVEVKQPSVLVDLAYDHPLRAKIESLDNIQKALQGEQFRHVQAVIALYEAHMGVDYRTALKSLVAGGAWLAYDAATQGAISIVRADRAETVEKTRDFLLGLARADAAQKGQGPQIKSTEYRGAVAYEFEGGVAAIRDRWLILSNKKDLAKSFVDQLADRAEKPEDAAPALSSKASYLAARGSIASPPVAEGQSTGWAFVDLEAIRQAGAAKELLAGKAPDNPLAELLFGGLLGALAKSQVVAAEVSVSAEGIDLVASAPYADAIPPEREYFFGPDRSGVAPPLTPVNNQLLSIGAYRDASGMWLHAGDLFDENTNDQLTLADGQLTTLFSGKDFGEEILGALSPQTQIVVARQDFTGLAVKPEVKLPAFAGVFTLKAPEEMSDELRRIFQSLVGFLNVAGAQNGQPQLDINSERTEATQIVAASYVPSPDEKKSGKGRIQFNFSPTAVFVGDKFILSSTEPLARELAQRLSAPTPEPGAENTPSPAANTLAIADAQILADVLRDNRSQLVAQNMLEEGRTQEEAEQAIDGLLTLVGAAKSARLSLITAGDSLRLEAHISLDSGK